MAKRRIRKRSTRLTYADYRLRLPLDDLYQRALKGSRKAAEHYAQRKVETFINANVRRTVKRPSGGSHALPIVVDDAVIDFPPRFDLERKRLNIGMTVSVPENMTPGMWADLWPVVKQWRKRLTCYQGRMDDTGFDALYKEVVGWNYSDGQVVNILNRRVRLALVEVSLLTQLIEVPTEIARHKTDTEELRNSGFREGLEPFANELAKGVPTDTRLQHLTAWRTMSMLTAFRYLKAFNALSPDNRELLKLALDPSSREKLLLLFTKPKQQDAKKKDAPRKPNKKDFLYAPLVRDQVNARLLKWRKDHRASGQTK